MKCVFTQNVKIKNYKLKNRKYMLTYYVSTGNI